MSQFVFVRILFTRLIHYFSALLHGFRNTSKCVKAFTIGFFIYSFVAPSLAAAAGNINFGRVTIGYSSIPGLANIEVCRLSGHPLTIGTISIGGTDPNDFTISKQTTCGPNNLPCACTPNIVLNGSGNCQYTVQNLNICFIFPIFTPTSYSTRTATAVLTTSDPPRTFNWTGVGGIILANGKNAQGANFPIAASGPNGQYEATAPIQFTAAGVTSGQTITWHTTLSYHSSENVPHPEATASPASFQTTGTGGETPAQVYTSEGGQLGVSATVGSFTDKVTAVVSGVVVPLSTIAAELTSLYATEPTPGLLHQIAFRESTCHPFVTNTIFNVETLWPNENQSGPPSGTYINLMMTQLKNLSFPPMATAWDWINNAQAAVDILEGKYSQVDELENYAEKHYAG
jgi:hypothetical protein